MKDIAIHWFRQDLRLADNPALTKAHAHEKILPIYIWANTTDVQPPLGRASLCWLKRSLEALDSSLQGGLNIYDGDPLSVICDLIDRLPITAVYWNRCYEPWHIKQDSEIKTRLKDLGVRVMSCNGSLLWEPWSIRKKDGLPYKVFTPFFKNCRLNEVQLRKPLPAISASTCLKDSPAKNNDNSEDLTSNKPWENKILAHWKVGEEAAQQRLAAFLDNDLMYYKNGRDFPALNHVSRLSPHLHFGEISPHQIWSMLKNTPADANQDHFFSELGWREFSYSQLYYNPDLANKPLQDKFTAMQWRHDPQSLEAWKQGKTGIPMVDAGMRELWQTGTMANRVRMIAASLLVKNLRLDWRLGLQWFWDTLVDADAASNSASWQWVAGCGADAAPYFRIFNPVTQGLRFDPDGHYLLKYLPELSGLSKKMIHQPWMASEQELAEAGVVLGVNYPKPIVDLKASRIAALDAFAQLKKA